MLGICAAQAKGEKGSVLGMFLQVANHAKNACVSVTLFLDAFDIYTCTWNAANLARGRGFMIAHLVTTGADSKSARPLTSLGFLQSLFVTD